MFNLYLYSQSFAGATVNAIENSLAELNVIITNSGEVERFWKDSDSLYAVNVDGGESFGQAMWSRKSHFSNIVLPQLLQRIGETGKDYNSIDDFERDYPTFGAFYGISFAVSHCRHICDQNTYYEFLDDCFSHKSVPPQFKGLANIFLPNLIFSKDAFDGISAITDSKLYTSIINALRQLDSNNKECWKRGYYEHRSLPVAISGESESTMKDPRLSRQRCFLFPDGKERCCELHVKINRDAQRIHIFPENSKIYVGYIGKHLPT